MNRTINKIIKIDLYIIVSICAFLTFYCQAYRGYDTDIGLHVMRIIPVVHGDYYIPHSMLHYITYGIYKICNWISLNISLYDVMVLLETFLVALILYIIYRVLLYYLKDKFNEIILLLISISLIFVTSIYIPFFNKFMYFGQGSPNTWHNPTTFIIKPIAILCFWGLVTYIQKYQHLSNKKLPIILSILFALSVWAKPSFAITFYPALLIFLIIYYRKNFKIYWNIFLILLPSIILLAIQYYHTYSQSLASTNDMKDNIIFTFFGVIRLWTKVPFISLLLAIAFPLSILVIDLKNVKKNQILILSWLNVIIAYLEFAFLAEKYKFPQGAFGFGYNLALFLLFIFSFIHLLNYIKSNTQKKQQIYAAICLIIYSLHLYSGVLYYLRYFITKTYT